MAYRLLLLSRNDRQTGQTIAGIPGEFGAAKFLKLSPARPRQIGPRAGDLAQETLPFDEEPVDVAAVDAFFKSLHRDEFFGAEQANNLGAAGALVDRHAVDEKAIAAKAAVGFLAGEGETSAPARFVAAKAVARDEIGHVFE
jgi:hypothetical protein